MAEMTNDGFQVLTLGAVKADGTPDMANILFSFPCPHNAMTISQAVKIDEVSVPGRSGKVKQATGYDDTNITVTIRLDDREERAAPGEDGPYVITRSAAEQLSELQAAFRDRSNAVAATKSVQTSHTTTVPTTTTTTNPKTGKVTTKTTNTKVTTYGSQTVTVGQVPTVFSILSRLTSLCGIKTVLFKTMDATEFEGETYIQVSMSFTEFEPAPRVAERKGRKKIPASEQYMLDMAYYDELEAANELMGPEAPYVNIFELAERQDRDMANKFQHNLALLGDAAAAKLKEYRDAPVEPAAQAKANLEAAYNKWSYEYDRRQQALAKEKAMMESNVYLNIQ